MNRLRIFAAAMMLALPVAVHAADTGKNQATPPLPKGHPPMEAPKEVQPITGKVLQSMDSGGYTYVYLQQDKGKKIWVAMPTAKMTVGKKVSLVPGEEFTNFKSTTLNRTFDKIIFSVGPVPKKGSKKGEAAMVPGSKEARVAQEKVSVGKAAGANAYTVAELFAQKGKLNGKKVVVKGKVVKVSPRIMKTNWVHIQDGTGSESKKNHDLVVRTAALPKDGETVTMTGTLLKDKDYGYGYKYEVIIDNAEIVK